MAFLFACKSAKAYQAKSAPKCNGGEGCMVCNQKWARAQKGAKNAPRKRKR
jgi:hypothetical protein